jgi:transcriptional regulator with XRE-family HTH domain
MNAASWFGRRLKELRDETGLSQKELATRAGVGQRSVSNWEQGLKQPTWPNVIALAEALQVSILAFLKEPVTQPKVPRGRPRKEQKLPSPARHQKKAHRRKKAL